ncbi:MAG: alpha/beta hydrolase [Acidobacteriota bacterium]
MVRRIKPTFFAFILLFALCGLPIADARTQTPKAAKTTAAKSKVKDSYARLDTFWDDNAPSFAGKRVITVDLIGHGLSDKPDVTYTMDLFAKSVAAVLKHAGVKRAVLVGHSMGTPVVRQFYRNYPQQTIALVLVDGALRTFGTPQQMAPMINAFKGPNYKQVVEQFITTLTRDVASKDELQHITTAMLATPQNVIVGGMDAMVDPTIWKDDPIRVPVLAIYAAGPQWTPDYFQYVHTLVPDIEEQVWDGVSHFLMMDQPPKFNSAVADFLAKKNLLK